MLGKLLNLISQPLLGYDVAIKDNTDQILILPIGKYSVALFSSITCLFIYQFSGVFFGLFSKTYRNLPVREKMFWSLAVLRGVYGTFGAVTAFYCRYWDEHLMSHVTKTRTEISYLLVLCNLGFFSFEMLAQIYFDLKFGDFSKALLVHHWLSLVGFITTTHEDLGHYFSLSGFIIEMSTPFSCICYCLMKSGMTNSLAWKINQLVLIHIFHSRILVEWRMLYDYYILWDDFSNMTIYWKVNTLMGLTSLCFFLTPYWTYRKTEQLFFKKDWNANGTADKKSKKQS